MNVTYVNEWRCESVSPPCIFSRGILVKAGPTPRGVIRFRGALKPNQSKTRMSAVNTPTVAAEMDPREAEFKELEALQEEMIAIIAKVCPNRPRPVDISVVEQEPIDPIRWPHRFRFDVSFKFSYDKHQALVLKFPLKCRVHKDAMFDKVRGEVGGMSWARSHSNLPIPKVRAFDPSGTSPLNPTRRPFICMDHFPGKHITNKEWERMSEIQKLHVTARVAMVTVLLSQHSFDKIGSLYPVDKKFNVDIGPLASCTLAWYTYRHGPDNKLSKLFKPSNSPYPTALEYLIDITNKHLVHRAIVSPSKVSTDYVEMWIYRSLLPGLVLEQCNRGPFVLMHPTLDRWALLFDDNYELTGVINWDWSQIEPLQIAAINPPFLLNLPISPSSKEYETLRTYYMESLAAYESEARGAGKQKSKVPPVLSQLAGEGYMLANTGAVAKMCEDNLSAYLWNTIFVPTFGQIDRGTLFDLFAKAPSLLAEHQRTIEYLQALQVSLPFGNSG